MTPTEELKHEHQIVLLVLAGAEREGESARRAGACSMQRVDEMVDFFRAFVDRCHHAKEERHLFPALRRHGPAPQGASIETLLRDHDAGRQRIKAIEGALKKAQAAQAGAAAELGENLLAYAGLLRRHIGVEDGVLFPFADTVLAPDEQAALEEAFAKVEAEEIGEGVHERYHQLAHEIAERSEKGD